MSCNPCSPAARFLGAGSSLKVQPVVRTVTSVDDGIRITNTDGSSYDLSISSSTPANVGEVNILNASGTQVIATVATLK